MIEEMTDLIELDHGALSREGGQCLSLSAQVKKVIEKATSVNYLVDYLASTVFDV